MTAVWSSKVIQQFSLISPEISHLPSDRAQHEDTKPYRIYFVSPDPAIDTVWDHPTLGPLPDDWKFCLTPVGSSSSDWEPRYHNSITGEIIKEDPRYHPETLKARRSSSTASTEETRIASSIVKNTPGLMSKLKRAPVGKSSGLRDHYEIVHTIDDGSGAIGAMNGGVHVVRLKGFPQLYVEKRFRYEEFQWRLVEREIEILHRIRHGSLTMYCAAFFSDAEKIASVYVEFCDRGSLEDVTRKYMYKRETEKILIPELFIWHAFLGLADGFAYLQGGRSYLNDDFAIKGKPEKGWVPLIHRDTKPDNILLRSRSTMGSQKYFYCILTDFGLCCEDNDNDYWHKVKAKIGTAHWLAPELLWDPYPDYNFTSQKDYFVSKHTSKSDIWALGAAMYNLTCPDIVWQTSKSGSEEFGGSGKATPAQHLIFDKRPRDLDFEPWMYGRASRKDIFVGNGYSKQLRDAIQLACRKSPASRPDAIEMVRRIRIFMQEAKIEATGPRRESDKLPAWATRVHDYHARAPISA